MTDNTYQSAKKWLPIAIKEIQKKLIKLKIRDSGELIDSVDGAIKEVSAGSVYKAELLYRFYGIFPEMGVGKGVSKDEVALQKQLGGTRKPRRWTREVAHQGHIFGEVIAHAMADQAARQVADQIKDKINLKF